MPVLIAEMIFHSSIMGPVAPRFYCANETSARQHESNPRKQQDVQPISAAPWHRPTPPAMIECRPNIIIVGIEKDVNGRRRARARTGSDRIGSTANEQGASGAGGTPHDAECLIRSQPAAFPRRDPPGSRGPGCAFRPQTKPHVRGLTMWHEWRGAMPSRSFPCARQRHWGGA